MSEIILTENTAKLVERTVIHEIPLMDFLNSVNKNIPLIFPILPNNIRGFISGEVTSNLIIEQAPRKIKLRFRTTENEDSEEDDRIFNFNVYMPYIYYNINIQNNPVLINTVKMAFATAPVTDENSILGTMPMPNIDGSQTICLGDINIKDDLPLHMAISELIIKILSSVWNSDLFDIDGMEPIPFFSKAIKKYANHNRLKEQSDDEVAKYLVTHDYNAFVSYLYAWDEATQHMNLPEFIKALTFSHTFTYGSYLRSTGV